MTITPFDIGLLVLSVVALVFLFRALRGAEVDFAPIGPQDLLIGFCVFVFPQMAAPAVVRWGMARPDIGNMIAKSVVILTGVLYLLPLGAVALIGSRAQGVRAVFGLTSVRAFRCASTMILMLAAFWVPLGFVSVAWTRLLTQFGMPYQPQPTLQLVLANDYRVLQILSIFSAVVLIPFAEEYIFRRTLFGALRQGVGPRFAVLLSAALFALVHIYASDKGQTSYHAVLPIFAVGLMLAAVYERTRSLYYPIVFHGLFNGAQIAWGLLAPQT